MHNTLGRVLRLTTAGESHGEAMVAILDGCPAGLVIDDQRIQAAMARRRPGQSHWVTQRQESDLVKVLSGVYEGKTTGSSIALLINNNDAKAKDYTNLADRFRPGHADYGYQMKYGHRDHRGGGRASARETAMWVAAGNIALQLLEQCYPIQIQAGLSAMGGLRAKQYDWQHAVPEHLFCLDSTMLKPAQTLIAELRQQGDSVGGEVSCIVKGIPAGLGDPIFGKLDGQLAGVLMGLNAVKAVEIGDGAAVSQQRGTEHRDEISEKGFLSNHAGGVVGGISTGQAIRLRVSIKPPSSIRLAARSLDHDGNACEVRTTGRHDVCVAIRAVTVVESLVALVLADAMLAQQMQSVLQRKKDYVTTV